MNDIKSRIFSSISREATPIYKVAQQANVCITTASKYCYILQAEKKIDISSYGNMKLVKKK
ncbi:MAG: hypothetical protein J4400_00780 [Candidatus Aenigmarchaeota archaeon]|nr:hypothetical protein [Candidatus Aenigmarchaeota archaeon]